MQRLILKRMLLTIASMFVIFISVPIAMIAGQETAPPSAQVEGLTVGKLREILAKYPDSTRVKITEKSRTNGSYFLIDVTEVVWDVQWNVFYLKGEQKPW